MADSLDRAVAEQALRTLGLLTIGQLDAMGMKWERRRRQVQRGILVPVHPRVFRHAAHPRSWEQTVLAGVLAAGQDAVASHMTASALWRFDGVMPPRVAGAVELSLPRSRQIRPLDGVVVHRVGDLGPVDVDRRRLIPCTTPARTLIDIAPYLPAVRLEAILDHAARRGLVWRPHLRWRIDELRRRGRRGVAQMERLLDRTDGRDRAESWLETEGLRLIARAGLPAPRCQVTLRPRGRGIARVDLLWDEARLVVELSGHGTHATRRQRQADAERAARIATTGRRMLTFTYEDVVERPHHVVATVRALLARAA
ncbi:MAG TPA: DUF559 domain-containing protein [Acidimicrobiales bacterium]|nr:DUF559 domain-containing protein [Acidimicrobiales bacterium]